MPFPFFLSSTASMQYQRFLSSSSHPSLPLTASVYRGVLRNVLKQHRHLPLQARSENLNTVLSALTDYLPYLFALKSGIKGMPIRDEEIDVALQQEIELCWRTTLSSGIGGRESPRVRGKGIDYEMCFVLENLALVYVLQARSSLLLLYGSVSPSVEQRTHIITGATRHMLEAHSIHSYLAAYSAETNASSAVLETLAQTQGGLAALAMADATLLAVLKDDPWPAVVAQDRNRNDKEWMIMAPEIPKVRAHLFARLCLAAAEHAGKAEAMLSASGRINEPLLEYVSDLRKVAKAKACRFFGINAELEGQTGKGIAWLIGAKRRLGYAINEDGGSKIKGIAKLKKNWTEKREDKKIEKGGEWGSDAGKLEELRIIEMLDQKWNKMNDTVRKIFST